MDLPPLVLRLNSSGLPLSSPSNENYASVPDRYGAKSKSHAEQYSEDERMDGLEDEDQSRLFSWDVDEKQKKSFTSPDEFNSSRSKSKGFFEKSDGIFWGYDQPFKIIKGE